MELQEFDKDTLQAQRIARNMVKRDTKILVYSLLATLVLLFMLSKRFPLSMVLLIPALIAFLVLNNWRQWKALIDFKLRCPHCGQLLAKKVNLFWSPSPKCRNCGEIALASIRQLKEAEQAEAGERI